MNLYKNLTQRLKRQFGSCVLLVTGLALSLGCGGQEVTTSTNSNASNSGSTSLLSDAQDVENELVAGPWLQWRGPNRNGVVIDQNPPTSWSDTENVNWKVKVPGRGHASPIVVDDQIILATANKEDETQSVVSFNLETGKQNWITEVNKGNFNPRIYPTNTHASSTMASDGTHLFAVFNNNRVAQLVALDLSGKVVWEKKEAAKFVPKRYQFGFGSSPIVHDDLVIVCSECEQEGSMVAFNKDNGEEVWRVAREAATSYSTPVVANVSGKEQLILSGGNKTISYNPKDGSKMWEVQGPWSVTCGTAVWSDDMVFVSGGFPSQGTMAIKADGSGEVAWQNRAKCYEQSMLYYDGYVYGLADSGVCYCWRASDGEEMWNGRMEKKVSASPVLANGHIYMTLENGKTYVIKANPEAFEVVAENQLGSAGFATASIVNNQLLMRVAEGVKLTDQEWLYSIGK